MAHPQDSFNESFNDSFDESFNDSFDDSFDEYGVIPEKQREKAGIYYGLHYTTELKLDADGIMEELDKKEWRPVTASENSRRIQHYGFTYNYAARKVDAACEPIPEWLLPLRDELMNLCLKHELVDDTYVFNQCIVNDYQPGQGISKHTDTLQYGAVIGCFTLGSGATMTFKKGNATHDVYTEPNSLYVMSGEVRYKWTHEMAARKSDVVGKLKVKRGRRISVTFRNVPEK